MKAVVTRSGSHQGTLFSEVAEIKVDGTHGPIAYAVPGEFPIGTAVEVLVTEVESAEAKEEIEVAKKSKEVKHAISK